MSLEFIVYKESGEPMYYYPPSDDRSKQDNINIISGYLSLFNSFLKSNTGEKEGISKMVIGNMTLIIKVNEAKKLYYVIKGEGITEKEMKKTLERASNEFEKKYASEIDSWNGDITLFNDFNYFKKEGAVDKFSQSFW